MRIGVDLGGTKIEAIALDKIGRELWRHRVPTPIGQYTNTLDAIRDLVLAAEGAFSSKATVGVCSPGAISPVTGRIKNSNSTVLNGRPLDSDLSAHLNRPIRLENDANCFALSEAVDGAGSAGRVVFGVILGTGVGGGLVVDKNVIEGRNRISGEWGHNPLPWPTPEEWPGPSCYCGKTGCIETFLSGAGLSRDYYAMTGRNVTADAISLAASEDSEPAVRCISIYKQRLARSLAMLINIVDPDVIVLGGGLSNIDAIYGGIKDLVEEFAFSDGLGTEFRRAVHGDSSGVRGAAWLWPADQG
jgi:fructokinase